MLTEHVKFDNVKIGTEFLYNGTLYIKKSSRTATLQEIHTRWFYFSKKDVVRVRKYHAIGWLIMAENKLQGVIDGIS